MIAARLRLRAAAELLSVNESTIRRWAKAGLIRRTKVGGVVWLVTEDLEALLDANTSERAVVPYVAPTPVVPAVRWQDLPLWRDRGTR